MTARMPTSEDYVSRIERLGTVIDGETLTHGTTFDVIDPATERVIASVPETPLDLVDQAVQSARRAFDSGPWPRMTPEARAEKIQRLADLIEANAETLAGVATSEIGAPITLSKYLHGHGPVEFFRWWADRAARGPRGGFEERLPLSRVGRRAIAFSSRNLSGSWRESWPTTLHSCSMPTSWAAH